MTTLAHPRTDGYGRPGGPRADGRALLERAVADAPSHIPPPAGWLRRLFARDRSAAALIRRYRLWRAIQHAYERVTRGHRVGNPGCNHTKSAFADRAPRT